MNLAFASIQTRSVDFARFPNIDAYDRISSYRDADGNVIGYQYDANGNLTRLAHPGNKAVTYQYDSLNRLTNVTDWANRVTSIEYDLASRVKRIARPNNTVRLISYDDAGQTTNIVEQTGAGLPIVLFNQHWNNTGRMDREFMAPLAHPYTPPTRTITYNDDNQINTFNGTSVVYDLDGNLTSGPLTNNTFASYEYDARNRLLSAGGVSYGYDPSGNRVATTSGTVTTRYVVNPNSKLPQVLMRIKNGVTTYYVYGLGLLYETDDYDNTKYYHYDYRGSTVAISDVHGEVTDRVEYSIYGITAYRTGITDTPFLYNGRYGVQTDSNGLLYMRARYYNPYLCRFLNPDPSGFSGGLKHGESQSSPQATGVMGSIKQLLHDMPVPCYGFMLGPNCGTTQWGQTGPYLNQADYFSREHDGTLKDREWAVNHVYPNPSGIVASGPVADAMVIFGIISFWINNRPHYNNTYL